MSAQSKRTKAWQGKVAADKSYAIDEALALVKELATAKFAETVDVAINLGIDAKKSDQVVRGSASACWSACAAPVPASSAPG